MNNRFDEPAKGIKRIAVALAFCLTQFLAPALKGQGAAPRVFNTGVDDSGAPLTAYTVDPHYTLMVSPDPNFPGPSAFVVDDTLSPIASGQWLANSSISKWIAPQGDQDWTAGFGEAVGSYTYRTLIDLTGADPDRVVLTGQWSCESLGSDVQLNGVSTGNATSTDIFAVHVQWNPLLITNAFAPGTNTLDFVVNRVPYGSPPLPTGLQVQLSLTNLPPPKLNISPADGEVLVWWPTNHASGYLLETSITLGANENWRLSPDPVTVLGDLNVVAIDPTSGSKFFRLHKP